MNTEDRKKALDIATSMIAEFEGCKLRAYQDSAGVWTIGYGHTQHVRRNMAITQEEADRMLREEVDWFMGGVEARLKVWVTPNQLAALTSLAYNIGLGAFEKSTLLRRVNELDLLSAKREFGKWNHAGGRVVDGLTIRRRKEANKFAEVMA